MDHDKLNAAAEVCLQAAMETVQPFRKVAECIASLKEDPKWTDAEIIEVQTRVIRELMRRLGIEG